MDAMSNWLGFSLSQQRQHGGSVENSFSSAAAAVKHGDGSGTSDSYHHHHHQHDDENVILGDSAQPGSFTAQMLEIATMSPQEDGGKAIRYYHHHHHHDMVAMDHSLHVTETCRKDWQPEEEALRIHQRATAMSQPHEYAATYDEVNYADGVVEMMGMQKQSHGPILEDFLGISSSSNFGGPEQPPYGGGADDDHHHTAAHNYEQQQRNHPFLSAAAAPSSVSPSYRSASSSGGYSVPPHLFPAETTPHAQQQHEPQHKASSFGRSCLQPAGRFPLEDNNNSSYGFHDDLLAAADYPPLSVPRHPTPTAFNPAGDETAASNSRIGGYKDSHRFCPTTSDMFLIMAPPDDDDDDDGGRRFSAMADARFLQMAQTASTMLGISHSSGADRNPSFVPTRNFSSVQSSWMDAMLPTDDDDDDEGRSCRRNRKSCSTDGASVVLFKEAPSCYDAMEAAAYSSLQAGDGVVEESDNNDNNNNAVGASKAHRPPLFTTAAFSSLYMTTVAGRPAAGNARNPDNVMEQHWFMESAAVSPPSHEASDLVLLRPPPAASDLHPQTRSSPDPPFDERLELSPMTALQPIIDPAVKADDSNCAENIGITVLSSSKKRAPTTATTKSPSTEPGKAAGDTFGQRTSQYRGVTRHRWTGRYEAHLWDNSCRVEGQTRKGRQVYLGGYDREDKAARAYDLAALKFWGPSSHINFPLSTYEKEMEEMKNMTRQEFVASLRRKSTGFSRGASVYRGVTRHHQQGRWQARIGRVAGSKDLYLGTYSTQEEAAEAYDIAAIKFRGPNAVTNFDISRYDVQMICASSSNNILPRELNRKKGASSPSSNNPSQVVVEAEAALRLHKVEDETETVIERRMWECKNGFSRHNIDLIASAISRHEACESRESLLRSEINIVSMVKLEENSEGMSSTTRRRPTFAAAEGASSQGFLDDERPLKKAAISLLRDQKNAPCLSEEEEEEEEEERSSQTNNGFSDGFLSCRITSEAMLDDDVGMLQLQQRPPARAAFLIGFHGQSGDHENTSTTAAVTTRGNGGISGDADCCWNGSGGQDTNNEGRLVNDPSSAEEEATAAASLMSSFKVDEVQRTSSENQGPGRKRNRPSDSLDVDSCYNRRLVVCNEGGLSPHGEDEDEDGKVTNTEGRSHELEVVLEGELSEVGTAAAGAVEKSIHSLDNEDEDEDEEDEEESSSRSRSKKKKKNYEWWSFAAPTTLGSVVQ